MPHVCPRGASSPSIGVQVSTCVQKAWTCLCSENMSTSNPLASPQPHVPSPGKLGVLKLEPTHVTSIPSWNARTGTTIHRRLWAINCPDRMAHKTHTIPQPPASKPTIWQGTHLAGHAPPSDPNCAKRDPLSEASYSGRSRHVNPTACTRMHTPSFPPPLLQNCVSAEHVTGCSIVPGTCANVMVIVRMFLLPATNASSNTTLVPFPHANDRPQMRWLLCGWWAALGAQGGSPASAPPAPSPLSPSPCATAPSCACCPSSWRQAASPCRP